MMRHRNPEIRSVLIADGIIISLDDTVKFYRDGKEFLGKVISITPNGFYLKHGKFVPFFGISSDIGDKYVLSTDILEKINA